MKVLSGRIALLCCVIAAGTAVSPPQLLAQFGRNKVQYQSFDWRVIETRHFDVYFYEEEREVAIDAARMAERSYGRLSRILDHEFRNKKPIILYASHTDFQQTNALGGLIGEGTGGVTESLRDRVIMPVTGSYEELQHVLTHELVHAFQFDILKRNAVEATTSPFAFFPSLWFMEGMAEYLSIGEIDAKTAAWIRDATLDGYLRSIYQMDRFDDFLSYRFGQSLWNYIGTRWGDETVGLLMKRSARLGVDRAFCTTLGICLAELTEEWHDAARATYMPQIAEYQNAEDIAHKVTDHSFADRGGSASFVAPTLSPDGKEIVYLSDQRQDLYSFYDLWLADAETGEVDKKLVKSARSASFETLRFLNSSAEFSPDGDRIVFVAKSGGHDALYIMNVRSKRIERKWVPNLNGLQNPSWSPDGFRIVFTGLLGGLSDLYVYDLRSGEMDRLTNDRFARLHPSWSPDGHYIAFSTDQGPDTDFETLVFGNMRIALYEMGTGDIIPLTEQEHGENTNPVWSPDGDAIAFLSTRSGVYNIYVWDRSREAVYQLTDLLTGATGITALSPALSWAREADRLAFSYFEEAGYNIYTIDEPRRLLRPLPPPSPVLTAASQVGTPRMIEGPHVAEAVAQVDDTPSSFYRTPDGFRRSGFEPGMVDDGFTDPGVSVQPQPPRTLSVAALRDSANLALPDTTSFTFRGYTPKLSPEVVGRPTIGASTGGFFGGGVYGGSFITLGDMLGNHSVLLALDIRGTFDNAVVLASYAFLKSRMNFGISFQAYPFFRFLGRRFGPIPGDEDGVRGDFDLFRRDRFRGVGFDAAYPFSLFSRLEFGINASTIQSDLVFRSVRRADVGGFSTVVKGRSEAFVQPTIAYVFDNALDGFTGGIAGTRIRIGGGPSFGDLNMLDALADIRNYVPLPGPPVFATRIFAFNRFSLNDDGDAERYELTWGGPYYLRGYEIGSFGDLECRLSQLPTEPDIFCPATEELIGSSTLLLNSELRFPILNPLIADWLPLNFPPIEGAVWFDVGMAFTPGENILVLNRRPDQSRVLYRQPLTAYGASVRANLFYAIVRVDYARVPQRGRFGNGVFSLSFGIMF